MQIDFGLDPTDTAALVADVDDQSSSRLDFSLALMLQVETMEEDSSEGESESKESATMDEENREGESDSKECASMDEESSEGEHESEESAVWQDETQVQDLVTLYCVQIMPRVMSDSTPDVAFTCFGLITPGYGHALVQPPVICIAPPA